MKDLALFRALAARASRSTAKLDELERLEVQTLLSTTASLPLAARLAFFPHVERFLEHEDAPVRAAAVLALAGAQGPLALKALIAALDDHDPSVRERAVGALHASVRSGAGGMRWVHALFHPRSDVRKWALALDAPGVAAPYEPLLLADPACAPLLRARIARGNQRDGAAGVADETDATLRSAGGSVAPAAIGAILDLHTDGKLDALETRKLLRAVPWGARQDWLERGAKRTVESLAEWSAALDKGKLTEAPGTDTLDELFAAYWEDADEPYTREFVNTLPGLLKARQDLATRVLASVLTIAWKRRPKDGDATACALPSGPGWLVAVQRPLVCAQEFVALEDRRKALEVFTVHPTVFDHAPATLDLIAKAPIAKRDDGSPDLRVLGALLCAVKKDPAKTLDGWVGRESLVEALARDPQAGASVFRLDDPVASELATALIAKDPSNAARVRALFVRMAPLPRLEPLRELGAEESLGVLRALLEPFDGARKINPARAARIAEVFGPRLGGEQERAFMTLWLGPELAGAPGEGVAPAVFALRATALEAREFAARAGLYSEEQLRRLVAALPHCNGLPYDHGVALARALVTHRSPALRKWAEAELPADAPVRSVRAPNMAPRALTRAEADYIASCRDAELSVALDPCFMDARTGTAAALARRLLPQASVAACAALLGSAEPPREIAAQFARYFRDDPAFEAQLDARVVAEWAHEKKLPFLGHAWLYRWEAHAEAALAELLKGTDDPTPGLRFYLSIGSRPLAERAWEVLSQSVAVWRFRDKVRLASVFRAKLAQELVEQLPASSPVCEPSARALAAALASQLPGVVRTLAGVRPRALTLMPDTNAAVRSKLAPWIASAGLAPAAAPKPAPRAPEEPAKIDLARTSDLATLGAYLFDNDPKFAVDAALRLSELGEPGVGLVLDALTARPAPLHARALAESAQLWPLGATLDRIAAACAGPGAPEDPSVRFTLALAALDRGRTVKEALTVALAAACDESPARGPGWFEAAHYERLVRHAGDEQTVALALAAAPHPHAYTRAVQHLMPGDRPELEAPALGALAAFLEAGTGRLSALRIDAARRLYENRDPRGLPLLWANALVSAPVDTLVLTRCSAAECETFARAAMHAGAANAPEAPLLAVLAHPNTDPDGRALALELVLSETLNPAIREAAANALPRSPGHAVKLRRIAETFAWGVRMGRELTGRLFAVEMATNNALGYTRMTESRIFVSPLPILRRERRAQDVVEGLILHELGHQMYHRSPESLKAWEQAQKENLGGVLNLVADEHLERNLRALDAEFGDRLKRLGAYAFQHTARELAVAELVRSLRSRSFEVLSTAGLGFARTDGCVRVDSGALLAAMERAGMPFARFMRALRMNLGNRHGDKKVAQGLALFAKGFRKKTMPEMLEIARELARIFGGESELGGTIGANEGVGLDGAESTIHGDRISQDEVQREVERITDPAEVERRSKRNRPEGSAMGRSTSPGWLNAVDSDRFDQITKVVPVPHDPAAHAKYADRVRRSATEMRRYFAELGLAYVPERMRLRGRRFDPTRTRALVLKRDPRILVARERHIRTDLFIGVVIDCSGSMSSKDHMERARLFGTLLAEAGKGFPGVDVRVFGFTDRIIYDAGDGSRCAAHALNAGGGNNDAGALWHVAQVAHQSRRRAKLLVMISDGLPTECTVSALRGLVRNLRRRWNMCCAQVAVQPLSEVCFPHYVVLEGMEVEAAVRRFGVIVAGLVRTTLRE